MIFQDELRVNGRRLFWRIEDCSENRNMIIYSRFIILSFFFVSASTISGMFPLRRILMAVQFGEMRSRMGSGGRLVGNSHGNWFGTLFWRCGLIIGNYFRRVLIDLISSARSRQEKKKIIWIHKTRAGIHASTYTSAHTPSRTHAHTHPHTYTHKHRHTHTYAHTLIHPNTSPNPFIYQAKLDLPRI